MGQKLHTVIQTEQQFRTLPNTLLSDFGKVNDYLTLFKKLVAAQKEYWRGMANFPAYWSRYSGWCGKSYSSAANKPKRWWWLGGKR